MVCVSPIWGHYSIRVPPAALGLWTRRSSSEQDICVWDHTSLLQKGADHNLKAAQKPSQQRSRPPCSHAQETPPGFPLATSKPGQRCRRLCISLSRPAKSLSSSSIPVRSREPPLATWHGDSARCSECVQMYTMSVCVFKGVPFWLRRMPALLFGHCLSRCVCNNNAHAHGCVCLPNTSFLSNTRGAFTNASVFFFFFLFFGSVSSTWSVLQHTTSNGLALSQGWPSQTLSLDCPLAFLNQPPPRYKCMDWGKHITTLRTMKIIQA